MLHALRAIWRINRKIIVILTEKKAQKKKYIYICKLKVEDIAQSSVMKKKLDGSKDTTRLIAEIYIQAFDLKNKTIKLLIRLTLFSFKLDQELVLCL